MVHIQIQLITAMTQEPISLSLFFPAYNEEENITNTVERAVSVVEDSPRIANYEIIIINDGSSDATGAISDQLARKHAHVRVVHHDGNKGYGAALVSGINAATLDYVFFTDADAQFDILELENLLIHVPSHELIIGYRAPRKDPFMRLANAYVWNVLNKFLFGLRVRDIDCAFKLFRREHIQKIKLHSTGAMINAEILVRLSRQGIRIKQVPVSHLPRVAGSPTGAKPAVILRALKELVSLYNGELGLVTQKQVMKFMTVGVINTTIDVIVYVVLTRGTTFFAESLTLAKLLSFLSGTVSSFILNRLWTFEVKQRFSFLEVVRFYSVVSVSLIVNLGVMAFLTRSLGIYDLVALLITTVVTFGISFSLSKAWVFMKDTRSTISRPVYTPQ
jgi:putative flippase GtrA